MIRSDSKIHDVLLLPLTKSINFNNPIETFHKIAVIKDNPFNYRMIATEDIQQDELLGEFQSIISCVLLFGEIQLSLQSCVNYLTSLEASETKLLNNLYPRNSSLNTKLFLNSFTDSWKSFQLFHTPSFINHSCNPNCTYFVSENVGEKNGYSLELFSLRPIAKGQEIYIDYGCDRKNRQLSLLERYGFECKCGYCSDDSPHFSRTCHECGKSDPTFECKCVLIRYCDEKCMIKTPDRHSILCGKITKRLNEVSNIIEWREKMAPHTEKFRSLLKRITC